MKEKIEELARQIETAKERNASPELIDRLKRDKGMMEIMHAKELESEEKTRNLTNIGQHLLRKPKQ